MATTLTEIKQKLEGIEVAIVGGVKHTLKLPLWVKILAGVVIVLVILEVWWTFKKSSANETILQNQQSELKKLSQQQKEIAEQDRLRDSTRWADFEKNNAQRNNQVSNYKKQSNDKINIINSPDFTNDSIRRAFAN
jgi:Co/Zn/Cd efflux system component